MLPCSPIHCWYIVDRRSPKALAHRHPRDYAPAGESTINYLALTCFLGGGVGAFFCIRNSPLLSSDEAKAFHYSGHLAHRQNKYQDANERSVSTEEARRDRRAIHTHESGQEPPVGISRGHGLVVARWRLGPTCSIRACGLVLSLCVPFCR